jgi:hypothetical protein
MITLTEKLTNLEYELLMDNDIPKLSAEGQTRLRTLYLSTHTLIFRSEFAQVKPLDETIGAISKPKDICFEFYDLYEKDTFD